MSAIATGPEEFSIRIKRLIILIPTTKDSINHPDDEHVTDKRRIKEIFQQYRHGRWWDVDITEEYIKMPFEDEK